MIEQMQGDEKILEELVAHTAVEFDANPSKTVDFVFEYKIMDTDYDNGEDDKLKFFAVDITFQGFLLGVNFNF